MSRARFVFAAHPDAVADLRQLHDQISDLALLELQNLVHGSDDCLPLKGRLTGFHKVYVDPSVSYRMVIQFRPAPPTSSHKREIHLAAASRQDYAVYRSAHLRTGPPSMRHAPKGTPAMTANRAPMARRELADLLTDAAQSVSEILTTEYPTALSRSYLHPVLGALFAGPQVVCELNDRLEGFVADEPLPTTPAGLFTSPPTPPTPPTPPRWDGSPSPSPS